MYIYILYIYIKYKTIPAWSIHFVVCAGGKRCRLLARWTEGRVEEFGLKHGEFDEFAH